MSLTPADHLRAVDRSLSTVTRGEQQLRLLTVRRTFEATPDEVWAALTTADRVAGWLAPVSGDLEVGGRFRVEGGADGEILGCERPERLAVSWDEDGEQGWVDVTLRPTGGGTLLQLDHSAPLDADRWRELGPGVVGIGWELSLMGLAEHLRSTQEEQPAAKPDGEGPRDYVRGSSAAWGEASIAAGTDPEEARAAAERCAETYPTSRG